MYATQINVRTGVQTSINPEKCEMGLVTCLVNCKFGKQGQGIPQRKLSSKTSLSCEI